MEKYSEKTRPGEFPLATSDLPFVDRQAYRNAMAGFGVSVCVVTTQDGSVRLGRTVTSVLSLSLDPPAILVSLHIKSELAAMIHRTGRFSFSILSEDQSEIADSFAGAVDPSQRFENGIWTAWPSGQPRLEGTSVSMDCAVLGAMQTDDNILFAGGVADVASDTSARPLLWHQRSYNSIQTKSETR